MGVPILYLHYLEYRNLLTLYTNIYYLKFALVLVNVIVEHIKYTHDKSACPVM